MRHLDGYGARCEGRWRSGDNCGDCWHCRDTMAEGVAEMKRLRDELAERKAALASAARRASHAEAALTGVTGAMALSRRKGRLDACRVLNEALARHPDAARVLRECVRAVERLEAR